jgi:hypothetical protein
VPMIFSRRMGSKKSAKGLRSMAGLDRWVAKKAGRSRYLRKSTGSPVIGKV